MRQIAILTGSLMLMGVTWAQSNLSRERGEIQRQPPSQWLDRGRIGTQPSLPQKASLWSGILLDASCADRSVANLTSPPVQGIAATPQPVPTNENVHPLPATAGITVAPGTVNVQRGRETLPDTADHASRYASASCAITAETTAFALLLPNGLLLNLDEGGNTYAMETFQATPAGQAILNGKTGGLKPHAIVKAMRNGDKLVVEGVQLATTREGV